MSRALDLGDGFRDVDGSDAALLASWLDTLAAHPDFRRAKAAGIDALGLRPGMTVVELGCGLGDDVRELAHLVAPGGRAIGIDASEALIGMARRRVSPGALPGLELLRGDAHDLPLADGIADAARVERTLQHVADPARALAELARVLRPGGRVVVWEPDWGTLMIAADPAEVGALVCRRRAAAFRHPHMGRALPALAVAAGLAIEGVSAGVHLTRDPSFAEAQFGFVREARAALGEGALAAAEVAAWEEDLARRGASGAYLAGLTAVRVIAARP